MRVLFLCHRIPYPPDKGEKIRAFHQLRAIAARHEVDLFTLDNRAEPAQWEALSCYCARLKVAVIRPALARLRALPYLATRKPLTLPHFYSAELERAVRDALSRRGYDRIFVYCSAMFQYAPAAGGTPVVTDLVDVDSDKWRQYARVPGVLSPIYRREARRLREYEHEICARSARVIVSTAREARLLGEIAPAGRIDVVRNGVDTTYFDADRTPPEDGSPAAIFTGDMSYFPNQEATRRFALEVLPLIRKTVPQARFLIVGRDPGPGVLKLRKEAGVEVTGFVPDVRPYLARARVAVAPFSIASGIQNKILEAMAYGLPVVATSRAAQGLSPIVAGLVTQADGAEEMAAAVIALLQDGGAARRKGREGRLAVAGEYAWEPELARLVELVENPESAAAFGSGSAS